MPCKQGCIYQARTTHCFTCTHWLVLFPASDTKFKISHVFLFIVPKEYVNTLAVLQVLISLSIRLHRWRKYTLLVCKMVERSQSKYRYEHALLLDLSFCVFYRFCVFFAVSVCSETTWDGFGHHYCCGQNCWRFVSKISIQVTKKLPLF
jgi:hypothetical protein